MPERSRLKLSLCKVSQVVALTFGVYTNSKILYISKSSKPPKCTHDELLLAPLIRVSEKTLRQYYALTHSAPKP